MHRETLTFVIKSIWPWMKDYKAIRLVNCIHMRDPDSDEDDEKRRHMGYHANIMSDVLKAIDRREARGNRPCFFSVCEDVVKALFDQQENGYGHTLFVCFCAQGQHRAPAVENMLKHAFADLGEELGHDYEDAR